MYLSVLVCLFEMDVFDFSLFIRVEDKQTGMMDGVFLRIFAETVLLFPAFVTYLFHYFGSFHQPRGPWAVSSHTVGWDGSQ